MYTYTDDWKEVFFMDKMAQSKRVEDNLFSDRPLKWASFFIGR